MTDLERACIRAAMRCLMADADTSELDFEKGMQLLQALASPDSATRTRALAEQLAVVQRES